MRFSKGSMAMVLAVMALLLWTGILMASSPGTDQEGLPAQVPAGETSAAAAAPGPSAGPTFTIYNGPGENYSIMPDVAYNPIDGDFLVVWQETLDAATLQIYAQRVDQGGPVGDLTVVAGTVNTMRRTPRVAFSTAQRKYLTVYQRLESNMGDIVGRFVSWDGSVSGAEFTISAMPYDEAGPKLVYNSQDDEFLVTWYTVLSDPLRRVMAQRVSASSGEMLGAAVPVDGEQNYTLPNHFTAYNAARNHYLVAFEFDVAGSYPPEPDVRARVLRADLSAVTGVFPVCALVGAQYVGGVAAGDDQYLVTAWDQVPAGVWVGRARRVSGSGSPLGNENGYIIDSSDVYEHSAATVDYGSSGRYLAVWPYNTESMGTYDISARYLSAGSDSATGAVFPVTAQSGSQRSVEVACTARSDCLVVYQNNHRALPGTVPYYVSGTFVRPGRVFLPLVIRTTP